MVLNSSEKIGDGGELIFAMAPSGHCAVVMLIADRAELVRDTADALPAQ
jgi:hypothetical protein